MDPAPFTLMAVQVGAPGMNDVQSPKHCWPRCAGAGWTQVPLAHTPGGAQSSATSSVTQIFGGSGALDVAGGYQGGEVLYQ